jgi:HPr Serine kinase C-terminal domain
MLSIEQIQMACARSEPIVLGDPMHARTEFPLRETFYPLGFPVDIETNSEEVLAAAAANWHGFVKLFDTRPIHLRIGVFGSNYSECPPQPTCKIQKHLASNIADGENFAISDLVQGFSYIWLTPAAITNRSYFHYFFLESVTLCHLVGSFTTPIHAACVELEGSGILLCGDSGAGKSTLAYACARAGWTYVTDDASFLVNNRKDRLVVGNCNQARFRPSAAALFPELSGRKVNQRATVGKPSIEMSTGSLHNVDTSATSHVNYVVFLNRRNPSRQELKPFSTQVAKFSMLQRMSTLPATLKVQTAMIDTLLERGALELHYSDLPWAIERLAKLAEEGR